MHKKIKILFVHHFPGMGGATMSMYYIVERLDKAKYDVSVLFLEENGDGIQYFREKGVKVLTMKGIPSYPHADNSRLSFISRNPLKPLTLAYEVIKSVPILVKWFENHTFDIVHLNTSLLLPFGKAAHLAGVKVVWHLREPLYRGFFGIRKKIIQKWIKRYADKIFAISSVEAKRLGKSDKLSVVYNYIDFNKFEKGLTGDSIRKEFSLSPTDVVVCNLGGLVHSKGAEVYVKAAGLLSKKRPEIKFLLVGDFKTVKSLQGKAKLKYYLKKWLGLKVDQGYPVFCLIKKYKLDSSFIFTGLRTDIPAILAASDILAWTATVPHFARPIIEASAMERAIIAADFNNTREAMIVNETGILFQPGNASDLANKIEILCDDLLLRERLGKAGKQLALKKFNADHNFSQIKNVYDILVVK